MAFIRTKRQGDREYAYVVETYWDPQRGTPRQRVLAYLGPAGGVRPEAIPEELRGEPAVLRWLRRQATAQERPTARQLERVREKLRPPLLAGDREGALRAAREAVEAAGPWGFLDDVLTPLMHAVGEDWAMGRITVADEHVAARGAGEVARWLREKVRDTEAVAPAQRVRVLLANPEGEQHALPLDVLECRLAARGHQTLVLPGELPRRDLASRAAAWGADVVLLSVTLPANATSALRAAEAVLERVPQASVGIGGQAWRGRPRPRMLDPRITVVQGGLAAVDALAKRR